MTDTHRSPPGYEFATWDRVYRAKWVREKIRAAGTPDHNNEKHFPVYIHGGTGVGKTCLAALLYRSKSTSVWRRADDLLLSLATNRTDSVIFRSEFSKLTHCGCLFLDDLGVRPPTDSMQQILFDLLEVRKGMSIVITSNNSPESLADIFDDRIHSRIAFGTVLHLSGDDRRDGGGRRHLVSVTGGN